MSDEFVYSIDLLKVKPEKRDALIALLQQNTDTEIRTAPRVEDDPADRGEGRRRPQAAAFHLAGRASSSKTPGGAISPSTSCVGNGTIATFAGFRGRLETNAGNTPTRRGDRRTHQPRFPPELRRIGGGA